MTSQLSCGTTTNRGTRLKEHRTSRRRTLENLPLRLYSHCTFCRSNQWVVDDVSSVAAVGAGDAVEGMGLVARTGSCAGDGDIVRCPGALAATLSDEPVLRCDGTSFSTISGMSETSSEVNWNISCGNGVLSGKLAPGARKSSKKGCAQD